MAKRLHDTEIWEQDWFLDLPNKYKMLWLYMKDKCDNAGIWRPNKSMVQKIIGETLNLEEFISLVNVDKERIFILPSGRWFIKYFFIFQYGDKFSPTSQVHKGALKALLQNGVHPKDILGDAIGKLKDLDIQTLKEIAYLKDNKSLSIAYGNHIERVIDKDKNIDVITEHKNEDRGSGGKKQDNRIEKEVNGMKESSWIMAKGIILKDSSYLDGLCVKHRVGKDALLKRLSTFLSRLHETDDWKDVPALKRHFSNSLNKHGVAVPDFSSGDVGRKTAIVEPPTTMTKEEMMYGWDEPPKDEYDYSNISWD